MSMQHYLQQYTPYNQFKSGQEEIVESILKERVVFARLSTGGGKTLCYYLPSRIRKLPTLVVSPLLSLMEDQVEQLRQLGSTSVVALNSFLSSEERQYALQNLNQFQFILLSPEMLQNDFVSARLRQQRYGLLVIDEAHCLTQWGHDFRPDYLRITQTILHFQIESVVLLSATADEQCMDDCLHSIGVPIVQAKKILFPTNRENIYYVVKRCASENEKKAQILATLQQLQGAGVLYCQSRKETEEWTATLGLLGKNVAYYHAGLSNEDRMLIQQQFMQDELDMICATNAFGMGVNKGNIRWVVHTSPSKTIEDYIQEIGRAGRDGKQSLSVLFVVEGEEHSALERIVNNALTLETVQHYVKWRAHTTPKDQTYLPYHALNPTVVETTERMLAYYYERFFGNCEAIFNTASSQLMKKIQKNRMLSQMYTSNYCIREQLLAPYQETLNTKPNYCCSVCEDRSDEIIASFTNHTKQQTQSEWQDVLAKLFRMEQNHGEV
ncbi:MAG: RecQ family ATP-dependent DNA helicase [Bacilli bacterium]